MPDRERPDSGQPVAANQKKIGSPKPQRAARRLARSAAVALPEANLDELSLTPVRGGGAPKTAVNTNCLSGAVVFAPGLHG